MCERESVCVSCAESAKCVCAGVFSQVCVSVSEEARGDVAAVSCFSPSLPKKSIPAAAELLSPPPPVLSLWPSYTDFSLLTYTFILSLLD